MDFNDGDTPWGDVGRVRDVLDFLAYVASLPIPKMQPEMTTKEWSGLYWILTASHETLRKAIETAEQ